MRGAHISIVRRSEGLKEPAPPPFAPLFTCSRGPRPTKGGSRVSSIHPCARRRAARGPPPRRPPPRPTGGGSPRARAGASRSWTSPPGTARPRSSRRRRAASRRSAPPGGLPPLGALAFSADGALLLAAPARPAAGPPAVYDVAAGAATEWSAALAAAPPARLAALPGPLAGAAFAPAPGPPASLLLHSAGALCHLDAARPLGAEPGGSGAAKRRRVRGGARDAAAPGLNGRALRAADPVLAVAWLSAGEALVVERPWADARRALPPPLYRHRYGT
jgi:hypothetical protein